MKTFRITNRKKITDRMEDGSLLIMMAGKAPKKTADESYVYTPNRNFLYLTGVDEEEVVMTVRKCKDEVNEALFIKRRDEAKVKWVGETISPERAKEVSGIEDIRYLDTLEEHIHGLISKGEVSTVWLDLEKDGFMSPDQPGMIMAKELKGKYPQLSMKDVFPLLSAARMIKEPHEVDNIRKAIDITREGIYNLMRNAKPGMKEYQLEAYYDFVLKHEGVKDFAFDTIIASGANATVLHYVANDAKVLDGELVMLDLGATHENYSADISRTFPINGKFTERQKEFYNLVLKAQQAVIDALRPGLQWSEINSIVHTVYAEGLKSMGIIEKDEEVKDYYYHGTSHHLGLNTHDVGSRDLALEEGMVLTVEPGIYVAKEAIGIRVEEDVLITKDGCEVLSKDIIKTVEEIEEFMARRQRHE